MATYQRRRPSFLEGVAGFGTAYLMGTADQWGRMKKDEKAEYGDSAWNYLRGKKVGQTDSKPPVPVETPAGQSKPVVDQAAVSNTQPTPVEDSGSQQTFAVPMSDAVEQKELPMTGRTPANDSALEDEMLKRQRDQYSQAFNAPDSSSSSSTSAGE